VRNTRTLHVIIKNGPEGAVLRPNRICWQLSRLRVILAGKPILPWTAFENGTVPAFEAAVREAVRPNRPLGLTRG